ncbi:hypothetical protein [Streptomyces sp. NPDC003393]
MATEDFPLCGDTGIALHGHQDNPLVYRTLGALAPENTLRTPLTAPPPPSHSSHFAARLPTALRPAITTLTAAALDRFRGE